MKAYAIMTRVTIGLAAVLLAVQGTWAHAAEIRVLSSNGVHSVLVEMLPEFERATGHKVSIDYDTAGLILGRIKGGEACDMTIVTKAILDDLGKMGKAVPESGKVLARSGVGVAVKAGIPKPDISTVEAFRSAILNAKSITFTKTGASGMHFAKIAERLGIAEQVKAKAVTPEGGAVGEIVARGDAEMAVQQVPELMAVKSIQFVGPLPKELQFMTVFAAGVMTNARDKEAAKALVDFLTTPAAARVFKSKGMEPQ